MTTRRSVLLSSAALLALRHGAAKAPIQPMAIGVMISPGDDPEAALSRVRTLGLSNCFLSLDDYIGNFSKARSERLNAVLRQFEIEATAVEVVGPGRLVWDFENGPSTIGLVPRATRRARIDVLKQASDFAMQLSVAKLQTHCGFLPENPRDPLYAEAVQAIHEVAQHCGGNQQEFLMETGQETPTTLLRTIRDVNLPNLGVGLDTANLILYGKANPVDALEIVGPHVKSVHAKDGMWPTDPMKLGREVAVGKGAVDFPKVLAKLHQLGYRGAITIEREISGPQQMEDIKREKAYLEQILSTIGSQS